MTARRDLLALAAGAVAARTVLPLAARAEASALPSGGNSNPDATLLELGAALSAAWARQDRLVAPDDVSDEAIDAAMKPSGVIVDQIVLAGPARGLDGLLVKAQALAWCRCRDPVTVDDLCGLRPREPTIDMVLMLAILGDLEQLAGASV